MHTPKKSPSFKPSSFKKNFPDKSSSPSQPKISPFQNSMNSSITSPDQAKIVVNNILDLLNNQNFQTLDTFSSNLPLRILEISSFLRTDFNFDLLLPPLIDKYSKLFQKNIIEILKVTLIPQLTLKKCLSVYGKTTFFQFCLNQKLDLSFFSHLITQLYAINEFFDIPDEFILFFKQEFNSTTDSEHFDTVFPVFVFQKFSSFRLWIESDDFMLFNFPSLNSIEKEKEDIISLLKSNLSDRVLIYFSEFSTNIQFQYFFPTILSNCSNSIFAVDFLFKNPPPLNIFVQFLPVISSTPILFEVLEKSIEQSEKSEECLKSLFIFLTSLLVEENVFLRRKSLYCLLQIRLYADPNLFSNLSESHQRYLSNFSPK